MSTAPKNPPSPADEKATPAAKEPAAEEPKEGRKDKGPKEKGSKSKDGKDAGGGEGKPKGKGGKAGAGPPSGKKKARPIPDNPNFRYIVRIAGSDLDGQRATALALTGVRGIGLRMAAVACRIANVNANEMIGNLPEPTVEGLETILGGLAQQLPPWMLNHPVDWVGGEAHHNIGPELDTARRDDINRMKMIRSYRGVRHERGQKVRGQRTRSNGRTGMAAGVLKKAAKEAAAAKGKEEEAGGAASGPKPAAPAASGAKASPATAAKASPAAPAGKGAGGKSAAAPAKGEEKKA
ncbi:MAG: 30S ribosomal protein S13 [Thermoplasmata archaeon]|nr:30S ribosomal protein S13 [Thermoplasmata archaeon]MCI4359967.1 30S ribosomal protein S13 [Thermoplasmata archaeon]